MTKDSSLDSYIQNKSLSPNTIRIYESYIRRWDAWRRGKRQRANDAGFSKFLYELAQSNRSPSTLKQATCAVRWRARQSGRDAPVGALSLNVYRACVRISPPKAQVYGITWDECEAMVQACADTPAGARNAAILSVMSWCLLRVSELVALRTDDIEFADDGLFLSIGRSKTDQAGVGATFFCGRYCAELVHRHIESNQPVAGGALFGVSAITVRRVIKRLALEIGLSDNVSGHSLRVGSAQELMKRGATQAQIEQAGRWRGGSMPAHYAHRIAARQSAMSMFRKN